MAQQTKNLANPKQTAVHKTPQKNNITTVQPNDIETVHVNVLMDSLSDSIIGLVIIEHNPQEILTLSHIRECIKSQFDEDQLQTIGGADDFKFVIISSHTLSSAIPISQKQEQFINIKDIAISEYDTDFDTNENENKSNSNTLDRPKRHYSLDIESNESDHSHKSFGRSLPSHLTVPTDKIKPKTLTINKANENIKITYYSILVQSIHNDLIMPPLPPTNPDFNQSFSIFERPKISTLVETEVETSISISLSSTKSSEPTIEDMSQDITERTQLERQFGGKLPRIRASKSSHKLPKSDHIQMTNILAHALVNDDNKLHPITNIRKRTPSYPILPTPTQLTSHISFNENDNNEGKGDVNNKNEIISYVQTNDMLAEISYMPSNDIAVPLMNSKEEDMDDDIKDPSCRFTVIGSPQFNRKECNSKQQTWIFYDPSELILGLQGVHHSEKAPIWMDLVCDHNTFMMISEHVRPKIHQLSIEDCVTFECREKLELFDNYLFICIHTSVQERLYIIVFKTMIITYHTDIAAASDIVITETRYRLEKRHKHKSYYVSPGWITHTIIDIIVDRMKPEIQCRVQEVQNVEYLVFTLGGTSHNELLHRLQRARDELVLYRSKLWPKSTITHNLVSSEWRVFLGGVSLQYWNDINDHVTRMVDLLNMGQSSLESCQSIFIAKISLEMANQSNELSDSAGKLGVVGSVFLPLAYLAGLWGMNCKVPFQYEGPDSEDLWGDSLYGFFIIVTMMVCMAVTTYKFSMKIV